MQPFTLYKTSWEIRPTQDLNPPLQVALPLTTIMTRIWTLTSNTSWVRSTLSKINKRRLRNKIGVYCKLQPQISYRGSTIHPSVRSFRSILILTSREINVNLSIMDTLSTVSDLAYFQFCMSYSNCVYVSTPHARASRP
jgi:hypothetical protein